MPENLPVPLVSVGLPVYNGEKYLRGAIDSILNQTFTDLELIISDNASTDATRQICEDYHARDARVRYYRNQRNEGVTWNFNRVLELARGRYFKWIGHDDEHDPTSIEKCLKALREREAEGYVCVWPNTTMIDENGEFLYNWPEPPMELESDILHVRFRDGTYARHSSYQFHGIIITEVLRETCMLGSWISSDYTLIGQLALRGKLYQHPEFLFRRRYHPDNGYNSCNGDYYAYAKFWVPPEKKNKILFPYWKMAFESAKGVFKVKMSLKDRLMCLFHVVTNRNQHRGFSQYFYDITHAVKEFFQKLFKPKQVKSRTSEKSKAA